LPGAQAIDRSKGLIGSLVHTAPAEAIGGGMGHVLAQLIPVALAAALSTVPIMATLFILLSERRRATALPFLFGWVIGTAAAVILATVAAQSLPGRPRQFASLIDNLEIVIGSACVVFGLVTLVRHTRSSTSQRPSRIEGIGSLGPLPAFGIGLALNLRPKALLLVAAAGLAISGAPPFVDNTLFLIAVYTAIATSSVVVPTLATVFFPDRMEPRLVVARDWVSAHGAAVTGIVMILVGVVVLVAGIGR
jgi:Sap, sulfolipid-1-addressing protein